MRENLFFVIPIGVPTHGRGRNRGIPLAGGFTVERDPLTSLRFARDDKNGGLGRNDRKVVFNWSDREETAFTKRLVVLIKP